MFRSHINLSFYNEMKRIIKFFSRKNTAYALFPLVPLFDNKYEGFRDNINDIDGINLNKLYKEFQKCNNDDLDELIFHEKIVEVLVNIDVRFLNEDSKTIYLHLLLISTNYCSINKDLKLANLISKLIKIYSTNGRYIIDTFPKNSVSKNLITKLKCYQEWNFNNETILDSLIKFLLSIKCKLSGGKLDLFEKALLLEMNRQRLYNLYISSFYNDIHGITKGSFGTNFVTKWIESLYYLIVINVIYVYNFIKFLQTYGEVPSDVLSVENDRLKCSISKNRMEIVASNRNNKLKNITDIEHNQTRLDMQYYGQRVPRTTHSEWSYSDNSTTFQLDRSRYSPRSEFIRQLPRCTMEPRWPE